MSPLTTATSEYRQTKNENQLTAEVLAPAPKRFCTEYRLSYRHRLWQPGDAVEAQALHGLQLDKSWEASFLALNSKTKEERNHPPQEDTSETFESALSTPDLTELLELAFAGIPVAWPSGMDARVAKIIVAQRASGRQPAEDINPG